jgi:four helix bundle protein
MMESLVTRTREFALRVVDLYETLPRNRVAFALGCQLLDSGTSPGAHFREALRARSKAEYVAKLNGGLMELEESLYWLELLIAKKLVTECDAERIHKEAEELIAIFVSLIRKWKP